MHKHLPSQVEHIQCGSAVFTYDPIELHITCLLHIKSNLETLETFLVSMYVIQRRQKRPVDVVKMHRAAMSASLDRDGHERGSDARRWVSVHGVSHVFFT